MFDVAVTSRAGRTDGLSKRMAWRRSESKLTMGRKCNSNGEIIAAFVVQLAAELPVDWLAICYTHWYILSPRQIMSAMVMRSQVFRRLCRDASGVAHGGVRPVLWQLDLWGAIARTAETYPLTRTMPMPFRHTTEAYALPGYPRLALLALLARAW